MHAWSFLEQMATDTLLRQSLTVERFSKAVIELLLGWVVQVAETRVFVGINFQFPTF